MNNSVRGILDSMWWNFGSTRVPNNRATWQNKSFVKFTDRPNRIKDIKPTTVFDPDNPEVIF